MGVRHARWGAAAVLAASGVVLSGCGFVLYRGPRGVEGAIERQLDCELDRRFGFKLGLATAPLATRILRSVADDAGEPFLRELHLRHVGIAVFEVRDRHGSGRLDAGTLGLTGWDTLVRVREDGEQVLLLSRPARRGGIRDAVLVAHDGSEVVLLRLKGDLDRLVQAAAEANRRQGT